MIEVVYQDGMYKVYKDGEQIRLPMSTGKVLPVEFNTREAAEDYARVLRGLAAWTQE